MRLPSFLRMDMIITFVLKQTAPDRLSITCKICGLTSHNQTDCHQLYCGRCNLFHEQAGLALTLSQFDRNGVWMNMLGLVVNLTVFLVDLIPPVTWAGAINFMCVGMHVRLIRRHWPAWRLAAPMYRRVRRFKGG